MYVCMYVSMYVLCMYVCMYLCMYYVCMYVCTYVCIYVCMYFESDCMQYSPFSFLTLCIRLKASLLSLPRSLVMIPFLDAAEELADQVSQLVLDPRDRTVETRVQTKCSLPKIPSSHTHRPSILTYNTGKSRTTCKYLPILLEECMMIKLPYLLLQLLLSHCHQL